MFTPDIVNLLIISGLIIFGVPAIGGALYYKTNNKVYIYSAMLLDLFAFIILITWVLMK